MKKHIRKHRRMSGITMVESLVALVVISVGMLGIAGLYLSSLQSSRSAKLRSYAVELAGSIADKICANRDAAAAYDTSKYGGKPKTMPPKLVSDDGRHIVIRPLAYCKEKDLETYAQIEDFPIIPCNLCGAQKNLQRQAVKEMMQQWDKKFPGRLETMFTALQNVQPSHLADPALYDFCGLKTGNGPVADGDKAFDPETFEPAMAEILSLNKG